MRVLITGGGGNLGRVLAPALEEAGHEPILVDNGELKARHQAVRADVRDRTFVLEALRGTGVVVHAAAEDGFTNRGDNQHLQFTKAVRAIKDLTPLGSDKAVERSAFVVEGVSAATVNRALDWLTEKGELCWTGAGKKGDPRRFYVPTIRSDHHPGLYTEG